MYTYIFCNCTCLMYSFYRTSNYKTSIYSYSKTKPYVIIFLEHTMYT